MATTAQRMRRMRAKNAAERKATMEQFMADNVTVTVNTNTDTKKTVVTYSMTPEVDAMVAVVAKDEGKTVDEYLGGHISEAVAKWTKIAQVKMKRDAEGQC